MGVAVTVFVIYKYTLSIHMGAQKKELLDTHNKSRVEGIRRFKLDKTDLNFRTSISAILHLQKSPNQHIYLVDTFTYFFHM